MCSRERNSVFFVASVTSLVSKPCATSLSLDKALLAASSKKGS
jgi:hypothetical protein